MSIIPEVCEALFNALNDDYINVSCLLIFYKIIKEKNRAESIILNLTCNSFVVEINLVQY